MKNRVNTINDFITAYLPTTYSGVFLKFGNGRLGKDRIVLRRYRLFLLHERGNLFKLRDRLLTLLSARNDVNNLSASILFRSLQGREM